MIIVQYVLDVCLCAIEYTGIISARDENLQHLSHLLAIYCSCVGLGGKRTSLI